MIFFLDQVVSSVVFFILSQISLKITGNRYRGYKIYLISKIVIGDMKGGDATTG